MPNPLLRKPRENGPKSSTPTKMGRKKKAKKDQKVVLLLRKWEGKKKQKRNPDMVRGFEPDVNRTRNLLIWSQTRYHCATDPAVPLLNQFRYKSNDADHSIWSFFSLPLKGLSVTVCPQTGNSHQHNMSDNTCIQLQIIAIRWPIKSEIY